MWSCDRVAVVVWLCSSGRMGVQQWSYGCVAVVVSKTTGILRVETGRQSTAHDGIMDMVRDTLTEREEIMGVSRLRF